MTAITCQPASHVVTAAGECPVCPICLNPATELLYQSRGHASMTTMCQLYEEPTEVYFCGDCGHLQTREIVDLEDYYAHQYQILAESPEEDQLYQVVNGRRVFQVEHRVRTLLELIDLPQGARVLDYGCAKGAVLRRLSSERPDVQPCCFDVTERYRPFWEQFVPPAQQATQMVPAAWRGSFDLVCSFYVLEHVADPVAVVDDMMSLLKPGGWLYFLVPNVLKNPADLVVADHLQHYCDRSLRRLLERVGLEFEVINDQLHAAAWIVLARKPVQSRSRPARKMRWRQEDPDNLRRQYLEHARFWSGLSERIARFEARHSQGTSGCIYGAGFYGQFIASRLRDLAAIRCFVDQNPFLHGRQVLGKPVVAPRDLATEVHTLYVGLNPAHARRIICDISEWQGRAFETFFLDSEAGPP